jgi:glycosyltransferase involved in cell wall biosynthesis
MRIVVVTEQYLPMVGGVATVTQHLSQDLAAAGHQVWVFAPSEGHYNEDTEQGPVHVHRFSSFEWPTYDGQRIAFPPLAPLRRLLRAIDPDVVHIHSPIVLGNLAQLLASSMHVPVVATNHYMPINMSPSLSSDPLLGKKFESLAYSYLISFYNRCDFVTAPTATALDLLKAHGLRAPSRPVSNGIDLQQFCPRPRDEALRRRLSLPADRPLILYVGRISPEKRVNIVLDALVQLRHPAHLVVGGGGPALPELEERASSLGIGRRVTFLGRVADEDLIPLYRLADVFVMPSVAELQSVAALEALAVGLPVVAADAGALPELVHDGENGFLFTPDDSAALAERLARLVSDADLRGRMSENALAVARRHDRRRVLDEWQDVYAAASAIVRDEALVRRRTAPTLRLAYGLQSHLPHHGSGRARSPILRLKRTGSGDPHGRLRPRRNARAGYR